MKHMVLFSFNSTKDRRSAVRNKQTLQNFNIKMNSLPIALLELEMVTGKTGTGFPEKQKRIMKLQCYSTAHYVRSSIKYVLFKYQLLFAYTRFY